MSIPFLLYDAVRPHAGEVQREPPGQKGEEEELVGEGMCVEGVTVEKTPYLCRALPVPGLQCGTWTPVPGQASGPGVREARCSGEVRSVFSKPKTGTGVEAHEAEIS